MKEKDFQRAKFGGRFSAFQIPKEELDRMFRRQQEEQELLWLAEAEARSQGALPNSGGGGRSGESPYTLTIGVDVDDASLPFWLQTSVNSQGPVRYSWTWGDGSTEIIIQDPDSFLNHTHIYPDTGYWIATVSIDFPERILTMTADRND